MIDGLPKPDYQREGVTLYWREDPPIYRVINGDPERHYTAVRIAVLDDNQEQVRINDKVIPEGSNGVRL